MAKKCVSIYRQRNLGNTMRKENIERLSTTIITKSDLYYLHYKSYHRDLFYAIKTYSKGDVLDIGCGNKPYEKIFEGLIDNYIGCDIIQSNLNMVDVLSPANKIPIEDNRFETIISTQTIEHVEDYQGLVSEAYRLLKPGGYFILSGPFNWQLHEEPYDFFRFTKHGFKYILEKAGFEVIELKENGGMWSVVGQYIIKNITNDHVKRNNKIRRLFNFLKRLKVIYLLNCLFDGLDKIDYNSINTINYVIIAKKK